MKLKKALSILLVTAMILSFAGCAREADNSTTTTETTTSEKQNPTSSNAEKEPDTQNENSTQEEQPEQTKPSDESQTKQNPPATMKNSDSNSSKQQKDKENHTNGDEPTEEELLELFERAMNDILNLATNDAPDVLFFDIFDRDIECVYSNQVTINDIPYEWTSRKYSELVDYYSQTFTGEPLEWILNSRFADVDGVLYCFPGGGATGWSTTAVSIEKLEGNTYKGTYLAYHSVPEGEEESTTFEIQKTDAGYRISDIGYRPLKLDPEELKVD